MPRTITAPPITRLGGKASPRNATPTVTATTGTRYVTIEAFVGPIRAIES
jgi:hypothetical protein